MTVNELIAILNKVDNKNMKIHVGCEGYTTVENPKDEYKIRVKETSDGIVICDGCGYDF